MWILFSCLARNMCDPSCIKQILLMGFKEGSAMVACILS